MRQTLYKHNFKFQHDARFKKKIYDWIMKLLLI